MGKIFQVYQYATLYEIIRTYKYAKSYYSEKEDKPKVYLEKIYDENDICFLLRPTFFSNPEESNLVSIDDI